MSTDGAQYYAKLAQCKEAIIGYPSQDGESYLLLSPSLISSVLRDCETFQPNSHPFKSITGIASSEGCVLLGINKRQKVDFQSEVRTATHNYFSILSRSDLNTGSKLYHHAKKFMVALMTDVIFGSNFGKIAQDVAIASDIIEDARACYGMSLPAKAHTLTRKCLHDAQDTLSTMAALIQLDHGFEPQAALNHAIRETMLNAFVPMTYAFLWTILLLGKHPSHQDIVIRGISRPDSRPITDAHVSRVVRESLRLFPPAWAMGRQCTRPTALNGFQIAAGDHLIISPYATHRSKSIWTHADKFAPDRFLTYPKTRFSYFPFGGGPHKCPAARHVVPMLSAMVEVFVELYSFKTERFAKPRSLVGLRPDTRFHIDIQERVSKL